MNHYTRTHYSQTLRRRRRRLRQKRNANLIGLALAIVINTAIAIYFWPLVWPNVENWIRNL